MKTNTGQHAQLYTDLSEMNKLKQQARDNDPAALEAVAQQFEQLFLNMLMKSMREANAGFAEDSVFNSSQVQFYQEMADSQLTKDLAETKGIGLADVLIRQLGGSIDVRAEKQDDQPRPLSESERILNRAVDRAANLAASAALGQAQIHAAAQARQQDEVDSVTAVDPVSAVAVTAAATAEPPVPQAQAVAPQPQRFTSPEQFVESLLPLAQSVASELGVDPKVLLAQAALETGWGRYLVRDQQGASSHNLFNIKADSRWEGARAQVGTVEFRDGVAQREQAAFRVYDSYEASFRDYADFLRNSPRYQGALEQAADPYRYLSGLQAAGYATDPEYANKISRIFDGDVLAGRSAGPDAKES